MQTSTAEYDYMTLDEIVRIYGWSTSYVYKLAHLHRWRRYRGRDRHMRYHRLDVDAAAPNLLTTPAGAW